MLDYLRRINQEKLVALMTLALTLIIIFNTTLHEGIARIPVDYEKAQWLIAEYDALKPKGITPAQFREAEVQQWASSHSACVSNMQEPPKSEKLWGVFLTKEEATATACGYKPALIAIPEPSFSLYWRSLVVLLPLLSLTCLAGLASFIISIFSVYILPSWILGFSKWITR